MERYKRAKALVDLEVLAMGVAHDSPNIVVQTFD